MLSTSNASDAITGETVSGEAMSSEKALMLAALNNQREHILGILDGLSDEDLKRSVLPTGWTPVGLVRHLTVDVEQLWFRVVAAGEQVEPGAEGWRVGPDEPAQSVLDAYRQETELATAIIRAIPMDAAPAYWPAEQFGDWRLHSLRELIMHVITETACHAGHLDAFRELTDGETWLRI